MRTLPRTLLALLLLAGASPAMGADATRRIDEEAHRLDQLFLSPCCWSQTLDIHTSPAASDLRREIRTRLEAGQTSAEVEAWVVGKWGEKIRAVPEDSAFPHILASWVATIFVAGLLLLYFGRRWMLRGRAEEEAPVVPLTPEELSYRGDLEDELELMG